MRDLKNITTKELVEELENRVGVETKRVDPYQDEVINVNGPCMVITVVD